MHGGAPMKATIIVEFEKEAVEELKKNNEWNEDAVANIIDQQLIDLATVKKVTIQEVKYDKKTKN